MNLKEKIAKYLCEYYGKSRGCNELPRWKINTDKTEERMALKSADSILAIFGERLGEISYHAHMGLHNDANSSLSRSDHFKRILALCDPNTDEPEPAEPSCCTEGAPWVDPDRHTLLKFAGVSTDPTLVDSEMEEQKARESDAELRKKINKIIYGSCGSGSHYATARIMAIIKEREAK